jgi:hypothetical protein
MFLPVGSKSLFLSIRIKEKPFKGTAFGWRNSGGAAVTGDRLVAL